MHRRENSRVAASGEKISSLEEHLVNIDGSFGGDSNGGENRNENVVPPVGDPSHLQPSLP